MVMEMDTFFRSYKKYNSIKNKFIYKIQPSYIFNLHSQCQKCLGWGNIFTILGQNSPWGSLLTNLLVNLLSAATLLIAKLEMNCST